MKVNITDEEFDAINEVLEQVCTDYEAATNEEYLQSMDKTIDLVRNVLTKYKKERQKSDDFKMARAYIAERNRNNGLRPRDIDRLTRQLLKKIESKE